MIKKLLSVVALASLLFLGACANPITETNKLIASSNDARLVSFASGLAACGSNAACQVGLSAAYFSGAGQQALMRPDTVVDYVKAVVPIASLGLEAFKVFNFAAERGGSSSGFVLVGNNNQLSGFGNRLTADNQSSVSASFESSSSVRNQVYTQAGTSGSGNGESNVEDTSNSGDRNEVGKGLNYGQLNEKPKSSTE